MERLADENTRYDGNPAAREYLCFALVLVALLLVFGAQIAHDPLIPANATSGER